MLLDISVLRSLVGENVLMVFVYVILGVETLCVLPWERHVVRTTGFQSRSNFRDVLWACTGT